MDIVALSFLIIIGGLCCWMCWLEWDDDVWTPVMSVIISFILGGGIGAAIYSILI